MCVRSDPANTLAPEIRYRFKHVLTQEVAYDTLLDHQRQSLHASASAIIVRRYADRIDEHLERLAHHAARATQWHEAVSYGIRSAERSTALSQFADALAMLDRTESWVRELPPDRERTEAIADVMLRQERLCETLGLRNRQLDIVDRLLADLVPLGPSASLAQAFLRKGDLSILLHRFDVAEEALGTTLALSRERFDRAGERNALRSLGLLPHA